MERLIVSILATAIFGIGGFIGLFKTNHVQQKVIRHYERYEKNTFVNHCLLYIKSKSYTITTKIVGIFAFIVSAFLILVDFVLVMELFGIT